jgi:hypothetical protein
MENGSRHLEDIICPLYGAQQRGWVNNIWEIIPKYFINCQELFLSIGYYPIKKQRAHKHFCL